MTVKERCDRVPHGELIVPRGHIIIRSLYQFNDVTEVYSFLHACEKADCSVYFRNEDISVNSMGVMSVPEIALSMYMHLKENPKMVEDYLRYTMKVASKEWAIDRVEVC